MTAEKSLDRKLRALHSDHRSREFILADAKDADMAWGISAPGRPWPVRNESSAPLFASMDAYRQQMREIVRQGAVDILLGSVSSISLLARRERLFQDSSVTPAIRANDATDIWLPRGGTYHEQPSRPFATCDLDAANQPGVGEPAAKLGLYSITFNNDVERDRETLLAYKAFRQQCAVHRFRHFLEVFAPNHPSHLRAEEIPGFVNDQLVRALAGVAHEHRPLFLKIPYFGPRWMEELVSYDSTLLVGVLGGSSGTTRDAFQLLADAKRHGARVALFGRKIKEAEHPLSFVALLRRVADDELSPGEAVKAYHAELARLNIPPKRDQPQDQQITDPALRPD